MTDWIDPSDFNVPYHRDGDKKIIIKSAINHHVEVPQQESSMQLLCSFCKKHNHQITNCRSFARVSLKRRWDHVKKLKLCFNCLITKHSSAYCKENSKCPDASCKNQRYNVLLHKHDEPVSHQSQYVRQDQVYNNLAYDTESEVQLSASTYSSGDSTHFRIIPVNIYANGHVITTNAFIDEGSGPTLINQSLADKLGVEGTPDELCLKWTDGKHKVVQNSRRIKINISGTSLENKRFSLSNVRTVNDMDLPVPSSKLLETKMKYKHLCDVPISAPLEVKPGMLIGLQHVKLGVSFETREGRWNEPIATRTRLGWVIYGKEPNAKDSNPKYSCVVCECQGSQNYWNNLIKEYFTTEMDFGATNKGLKHLESKEDERAYKILQETTMMKNKQYETGLLWRFDSVVLPSSRSMAEKRLYCLERKMEKDPEIKHFFTSAISDYLAKGYARKLTPQEAARNNPITWYLPMFVVKNPNKPGKSRIVWDAAAKVNGVSLNDVLLKGPDQLCSLQQTLFKFRERNIGIAGDIKEMYHRVNIQREDQDSQRFLFRSDKSKEPETYAMQAMTFGSTCSPASAQYVKNLNANKYVEEHPRAVEAIISRHYVDDWLDSFDTEEQALAVIREVTWIHAQGGMEIRNWLSNSSSVMTSLGVTRREKELNLNVQSETQLDKVLGLCWSISGDYLTFKLNLSKIPKDVLEEKRAPTKREILRIVMSLFDPLGFVTHLITPAKALIQETWIERVDWDQGLPVALEAKWRLWFEELKRVETVVLPRCYTPNINKAKNIQLHIFVDASERAYVAVGFLRVNRNDSTEIIFVSAKSRVAPTKKLSIPRLELLAAVLGTRLSKAIVSGHSIKFNSISYWSDSQTVLNWINSDHRKFQQFVAYRIAEILEVTDPNQWRWVPSKLNVADLATKWDKTPILNHDSKWFLGPEFLINSPEEWPASKICDKNECEEVLRVHVTQKVDKPYDLLNVERFSSWSRMLRSVAWAIRFLTKFVETLKHRKRNKTTLNVSSLFDKQLYSKIQKIPELTAKELYDAEIFILKKIQADSFAQEIFDLKHKNSNLNSKSLKKGISKSSFIYTLCPWIDNEGLLRVRGRLDAVPSMSSEFKRPIILGRDHYATLLIVRAYHNHFHHQGIETVVNEVRQKFWVPRLRAVVNKVRLSCAICRIKNAKSLVLK
jgi:hypothetical protein